MATARKLKSGSWRCLAFDYTDVDGKRHYKSFTAATKKEAEHLATEYSLTKSDDRQTSNLKLSAAMDAYIESRSSVLSAGTIREYKRSRKCDLQELMDVPVGSITQDMIQRAINKEALTHAPKSVRNMHGLLSAVLKVYRPSFLLNTSLPQKVQPNLYIPTDDDVRILLQHAEHDNEMMLAILLAAFGPMRRSEICALESGDISGNIVHVQRALVLDENKNWVIKTTKSVAGTRYIPFPEFVIDRMREKTGRIIELKPNQISDRFIDIQKATGLPHFRFHDLRHYCASIQHAMGIPDAYIMQRGGWGSDTVLKQIYRHALSDQEIKMNAIANSHFEAICNTKCNTKQKKP